MILNDDVLWGDLPTEIPKEETLFNNEIIKPHLTENILSKIQNTIYLNLLEKIMDLYNEKIPFSFVTQDKQYNYEIIDLDTSWIPIDVINFFRKLVKDLNYAIIIENKLNKMKSILIIKSDDINKIKKLRYNYAKNRKLPF